MARLDSFLRLVAEQHASDLHFHAGNPPIIRHDGLLLPLPFRTLTDSETRRFLTEIMTPDQRTTFDRDGELDFAYALEGVARFRVNVFVQSQGVGSVFRIIPARTPTIDDLGLPNVLRKIAAWQNGLVMVTGATGSGKTSTLAAIIGEINATSHRHIITIEDPIEYIHSPIQCAITQRQVGLHTESFHAALRSALREAPDVLVIGEMRDLETISLALHAAETGVLVFGTLHTGSASKSIDRVIDMFPDEQREQVRGTLSVILRAVVSQHLLRRVSGEGRIAAVEVLLQSYALANLIREGKTHQIDAYIQGIEAAGGGVQSLDACLLGFVREGIVRADEALGVAAYPEQLAKTIADLPPDA
jgi:twitching motility protein PilT